MDRKYVLVINPGSTSTKASVFEENQVVASKNIEHKAEELDNFKGVIEQYDYRLDLILNWLKDIGINLNQIITVVGRGGLLRPISAGVYLVTEAMTQDLKIGIQGEHASNLGGLLAKGIGDLEGVPSYIVDPVAVDEFEEVARISGLKEIPRRSLVHALNIKAVCYRRANEIEKQLEDLNLIVAHLGGGISIAPIKKGKIVDVNNANQMGPYSPERAGGLPVGDIAKMCFSGEYTLADMKIKVQGKGGLYSYLNTTDGKKVVEQIESGDEYAKLIYDAMAYQIGKEIGSCAPILKGKVDNIILTGGLAYSKYLVDKIMEMVDFIAPIVVYPGEDEMDALNKGVLRVINALEKHKIYEDEVR